MFAQNKGTSQCERCPAGFYISSNGSTACLRCAEGWYVAEPGASACHACSDQRYTLFFGATSIEDCVCMEGTIEAEALNDDGSKACTPCQDGLVCLPGALLAHLLAGSSGVTGGLVPMFQPQYMSLESRPLQADRARLMPEYMSSLSSPLQVWRCSCKLHCPGGAPGSCGINRLSEEAATLGCSACVEDFFDHNGECLKCARWMLPTVAVLALATLTFVAWSVNRPAAQMHAPLAVAGNILGLGCTAMQCMSIFDKIGVNWLAPVADVIARSKFVSFDLGMFGIECYIGGQPTSVFIGRLSLLPVILLAACSILGCRHIRHYFGYGSPVCARYFGELTNTIGRILMVFFISVCVSLLVPFQCIRHPSGEMTTQVYRSVLCWQPGDHYLMLGYSIAILSMLLLPYISVCIWATLRYPKASMLRRTQFLHCFRFLFFRFRPKRYASGLFLLARGFALSMVPIVYANMVAMQVLWTNGILACSLVLQCICWYWRGDLVNYVEASVFLSLIMFVTCGALVLDVQPDLSQLGWMCWIVFSSVIVILIASFMNSIRMRYVPRPMYSHFICHHKVGAAAQSRVLQLLIQQLTGQVCFIDSDHLVDLDSLYNAVRSCLRNLVVYLTSQTMRRPWCVGEMTWTIWSSFLV